jgi:hypothetical protein
VEEDVAVRGGKVLARVTRRAQTLFDVFARG